MMTTNSDDYLLIQYNFITIQLINDFIEENLD
jgi:hypothetical protein